MRETFIFQLGDRVQVSEAGHWCDGASGVICNPPPAVRESSAGWRGCRQEVASESGPIVLFWVAFDSPQRVQSDTESPCEATAIAAHHLVLLRT